MATPDKNGSPISVGTEVKVVDYSDDLLRSLASATARQAVVSAVGKRYVVMGVRDGLSGPEVLLNLPSASPFAKSGGNLVWASSWLVEACQK